MGGRKCVCYNAQGSSLPPLDKCPGSHVTPSLISPGRRLNLPASWIPGREYVAQAVSHRHHHPTPLATGVGSEEHTGIVQAAEELGEAGEDLPLFREGFRSQPSLALSRRGE